ncbi:MAG: hypothetical protein WCN88_01785 [Candidatus Falkowbacteria bacterium]
MGLYFFYKNIVLFIFTRVKLKLNVMTCCCLTNTDEEFVEEITEKARECASRSENEAVATSLINQIKGVKITGAKSNGATGSYTFSLQIDLPGENRTKTITITTRFNS